MGDFLKYGIYRSFLAVTEKDWEDIKFGVDNKVDFYAVSFVKDAKVIYELKDYLRSTFHSSFKSLFAVIVTIRS